MKSMFKKLTDGASVAVIALATSASTAFAAACVDEGAGNRDNVQHYKNISQSQADKIIAGVSASDLLASESSANISNVIHRTNDHYLGKLGIDGRALQKDATGELSNLQTIIGKGRGLSSRQVQSFPKQFHGVVEKLNESKAIENFGLSLGVIAEQFIRNKLADLKDDPKAVQTLQEWSKNNNALMTVAIDACEIVEGQDWKPKFRNDLKGMLDALRDGILDGDALRKDFEKGLKGGQEPQNPEPQNETPPLRKIDFNYTRAPWSDSDGYEGQQRAVYKGPKVGTTFG